MDRKFILTALGYAIVGLLLGIHMAMSGKHVQHVTHAHIMLLGFVVSFAYGVCHKLWLGNTISRLAVTQYYLHQAGVIVLLAGLYLMYGNDVDQQLIGPVLGIASLLVLSALVMMKVLFIQQAGRDREPGATASAQASTSS